MTTQYYTIPDQIVFKAYNTQYYTIPDQIVNQFKAYDITLLHNP